MEDSFDVNCSRYHSTILAELKNNHELSDITLVVGRNRYLAHKLILGAASPVFRQMFDGKWKESKEKFVTLDEPKECHNVFEIFLDFIYGCKKGTISLHVDDVKPLLILADKYQVDSLRDTCSKFMETLIEGNIDRAFAWLTFAESRMLSTVVDRCYEVICWNLKKAAMSDVWPLISVEQLLAIVRRLDVIVDAEYEIFLVVEEWCKSQSKEIYEETKSDMEKVISSIEYGNMTTGELQKVQESPITKDFCFLAKAIRDAIALRSLETEFCLAIKTKRRYLRTKGTKCIDFQNTTADHINSATLNGIQNFSYRDGTPVRCDFTFEYKQSKEQKVFRIVGFRRPSTGSMHMCYGRSGSSNSVDTIRVVGIFLIKSKETGIIHHVLDCNEVMKLDKLEVGDSIVDFPRISSIDISQFQGNYLGQFEIRYRIAVKLYHAYPK